MRNDCEELPLLLSIANIHVDARKKETSEAFALTAYLPVPQFLDVSAQQQSILARRVYHRCLDIILADLKDAEDHPRWMLDPHGQLRLVHTPLVAWIADYPDQWTIAGISPKGSKPIEALSVSKADDVCTALPSRMRQRTLELIHAACSMTDPWNLPAFSKTAGILGLNGVVQPFWRDWGTAEPSSFLVQDTVDLWQKFFYNHCLEKAVDCVGGPELDRRLSLLQPRLGVRRWEGLTRMLRCIPLCDLETILPGVVAGVVPEATLCAVRATAQVVRLLKAHGPILLKESLHALPSVRHDRCYSRRYQGHPFGHCGILCPHAVQHVVFSICAMGSPDQWSTVLTERYCAAYAKTSSNVSSARAFGDHRPSYNRCEEMMRALLLRMALKVGGSSPP
ncbi:hypothetical protein BV25DRAFT_1816847 [Artomyces pyxidatus]|uniref:Uncharacterized protein n=1 Tax=Artomyces pyxidatus TaxID=48021 RepID=A0ACB8SEA6_9AGAM|nr:hypothetical protein BV25DRAFT_1816847 [Artomyces pyxidatus]